MAPVPRSASRAICLTARVAFRWRMPELTRRRSPSENCTPLARSPDLWLGLQVQPQDSDQRRQMAGRRSAVRIEPLFTCGLADGKVPMYAQISAGKSGPTHDDFRTIHVGPDQTAGSRRAASNSAGRHTVRLADARLVGDAAAGRCSHSSRGGTP